MCPKLCPRLNRRHCYYLARDYSLSVHRCADAATARSDSRQSLALDQLFQPVYARARIAEPESNGCVGKYARLKEGAPSPFIDTDGYQKYVAQKENAFQEELARQKALAP